MKPSRVIRLAALLAAVALVVAGCGGSAGVTSSVPAQVTASPTTSTSSTSSIGLSPGEEKRLDDLDATGVAQIYFLSGDPAVEFHLSAPWLRRITTQPNAVPEHEREGGIDDLVVEGPLSGVPSQVYSREEWPEQLHFRVTYTSRKMSSIGEPPGKRLWFVIIGRQTADSPWKILEIGSGP